MVVTDVAIDGLFLAEDPVWEEVSLALVAGADIVAFDGLFLVDDIAGPEVFLDNSAECWKLMQF